LPGRVGVDQLERAFWPWWCIWQLGLAEGATDFAGGQVSGELARFDPFEELGVVVLDGGGVLDGAGGDAGPGGDVVSGFAPRWQFCPLGVLAQVLPAPLLRLAFEFAVAVELEREGGALRSAEVAALEGGEDDVLGLVGWIDDPD